MVNYFVIAFSLIAVVAGKDIKFRACPNAAAQGFVSPTSVDISPCTTNPCVFKHGTTAKVAIKFVATDDQKSLKAAIYGYILQKIVPFDMPNSDGCKDSGITCPITKGHSYTYQGVFKVLRTYPVIKVAVEWRLNGTNANGDVKNNFCFTFPVQIQE